MKIASISLIAFLCVIALGCKSQSVTTNTNTWQDKAALVTVGMTRLEVEKLLPRHSKSTVTTTLTGGSQSSRYWVDKDWSVSITYDYSGISQESKDAAHDMTSPHNKVLTVPVVARAKMPEIKLHE